MKTHLHHFLWLRWYAALACLTALILKNGGAHNPFTVLFIAVCSLAAMSLPRKPLAAVIFFALACLWVIYSPLPESVPLESGHEHHHDSGYDFHLKGMWLANSIAVTVISLWIHFLRVQNEKMSLKNQETQRILQNLERVDTMGRLLAAAAHKLNTPLTTVQLGISELSDKKNPPSDEERDQWLGDIQKSLHQITGIFQALKGENVEKPVPSGKGEDLSIYLEALTRQWADQRGVSFRFHSEVGSILVSEAWLSDLYSAWMAILDNAYQSRDKGWEIEITLIKDGENVVLGVKDNGKGMDELTLSRAAEPLFTTKKTGTGLGLYLCHQLAKKLKGHLDLRSQPGKGSEVILYLSASALNGDGKSFQT